MKTSGEVFSPRTGHTANICLENIFVFGGSDNKSIKSDFYKLEIKK